MQALAWYLLKMSLCSGVLLGYYWLALRNERFHHWNRFYLLAALVLSLGIPLVQIPLLQPQQPTLMVHWVSAMPWNRNTVTPAQTVVTWPQVLLALALLVSTVLAVQMLWAVAKVVKLYRLHGHTWYRQVSLVLTAEPSAPFSFFKWLFWRHDIDPDSPNGQRMLQHELAHIEQHHSADKLFTEMVLIVFWINPFFWLIRRELYAIHEFLADQKAIDRYDGAAFAAMILQAAHSQNPMALTNPFFTSQLKRRLHMITTSKQPQYSYLRRLSGLVMMVLTALALAIGVKQVQAQRTPAAPKPPKPVPAPASALPDSITTVQIWDKKGTCMVTYTMKDGRVLKMTMDQAKTKGYPVVAAPPPPPAPPSPVLPATPAAPIPPATGTEKLAFAGVPDGQEPLFIFAGLEITRQQMDQIKPEQIERIEVLKNEQAVTLYGQKGKNGVIAITPKIAPAPARAANEPIVVMGYPTKLTQTPVTEVPTHNLDFNTGSNSPLVYINKTLACMDDLKAIPSNQIRHIQVLKGQQAIEKYGADATNGVLLVAVAADGTEPVFTATEQMPAFPGGRDGWLKYLERNLRYPDAALKNGTQGKVQVEFLVDVYGNISNIKALNNPGDGLAEEAIKLIAKGPKWVPAVQNGLVVNAKVVQDITFRLE